MLEFLAIILGISPAFGQSYLIYPSLPLCQQRSAQMCQAMNGGNSQACTYWWDCSTELHGGLVGPTAVASGSYALRIDSGRFGATSQNLVSNGVQGLTATEQATAVPAASIQSLIVTVQQIGTTTGQAIP